MSKRSNRLFGAFTAALLVVVLSGVAFAIVRPQLTLHATSPSHRRLTMAGTYYPVNTNVCPIQRKVFYYVDGILRTKPGVTNTAGRYRFTRIVTKGLHTVQTRVKGRIFGVHPNQRVCAAAWSNLVTIQVK